MYRLHENYELIFSLYRLFRSISRVSPVQSPLILEGQSHRRQFPITFSYIVRNDLHRLLISLEAVYLPLFSLSLSVSFSLTLPRAWRIFADNPAARILSTLVNSPTSRLLSYSLPRPSILLHPVASMFLSRAVALGGQKKRNASTNTRNEELTTNFFYPPRRSF